MINKARNRIGALLLVCIVLAALSCAGRGSSMQDGYYTAEAAEFDSHGWKEYVTVYVSGGRITLVEYNACNDSGFIKSWDMDYMRQMNALCGTYPNAYTRYYGRALLNNQGTEGIDCITGATNSYHVFLALADAALENARRGDTETRLVPIVEPEGESHDR